MAAKLSNGNYRGRVRDPRSGKQIAPHTVIGGPRSYRTQAERDDAQRKARAVLLEPNAHLTVREWWEQWTTSDAYGAARGRSPETIAHNRERTRAFVDVYGERLMRTIDRNVAHDWIADMRRLWTVPAVRAMFNDAERAGKITHPPFNKLGLAKRTRVNRQLPSRADIDRLLSLADELTPPSFAAYLFTTAWQGIRPGESDALRWDRLDFDAGAMMIDQQWSAKGARFKEPKHGSTRKLPMVPAVRDRLADLPRESEFVFTTLLGHHYTPVDPLASLEPRSLRPRPRQRRAVPRDSTLLRDLRDRAARPLVDDVGWYCGHRGAGGRIVRDHYLHPDDDARRERIASKLALIEHPTGQRQLEGEHRARRLHSVSSHLSARH